MKTEVIVSDEYGKPQVMIHERETPGFEARIALSLAERWGLIAWEADGEDSAGRSKARRMTPKELATHSCDAAKALADEFAARGWMTALPSLVDHIAAKKAADEKKEEDRRRARAQ